MSPDPIAGEAPRESENPGLPGNPSPDDQEGSLNGLTENLGLDPATPNHDPLIGTTIGGVRIIRSIAEGGMGRVYEGLQDKPRRPVAVKVLRPGLISREICRRFDNESELLGRLRHPHIAQIYSAGVCEVVGAHVPYFVMEFIPDAKPITEYVIDKKLETQQKLELFRKVCEAVAHGHEKGVIHRDLKPSNILVEPSGDPKVIDFGVARSVDKAPDQMTALTEIGQLVGTVQYMSPEQFFADPTEVDTRADVYALGVILYEILTGKPPYEIRREQIFAAAEVVRKQKPVSPSKLNRTVQPAVEKITGRCLQKDRAFRYANAAELAGALGSYLAGGPVPQPRQRMRDVFAVGLDRWRDWRSPFRWVALVLPLLGIAGGALYWFRRGDLPAELDQRAVLREDEGATSPKTPIPEVGGLTYAVEPGGVAITGYTGMDPVIAIPQSIQGQPVIAIGNEAFKEKSTVTRVVLPRSVTRIGHAAFRNCRNLAEVVIPEGMLDIEDEAFTGTALITLELPATMENFGGAPYATPHLASINVAPGNPFYKSIDGILYDAKETVVIRCPENREKPVVLPKTVRALSRGAFLSCRHLEKITLPEGLEEIGAMAFYDCSNLKSIAIPRGVRKINAQTFVLCGRLSEISFSEGLESIDDGVFWGCGNLTRVTLPNSLTNLHENAFENCPAKLERPDGTEWKAP